MRRIEAVLLVIVALLALSVSAVWLFGPFGLAGAGVVLLSVALFVPIKEGPS